MFLLLGIGGKAVLMTLMNYQFTIVTVLMVSFIATLSLNKKMIAVFISLSFLTLGILMFFSGFITVKGFEGMGVSMAGIVYFTIGLITLVIINLVIYLRQRNVNKTM